MTVVNVFLAADVVRGCVEVVCEISMVLDSGCVICSSTSPLDASPTNDLPAAGEIVTEKNQENET